MVLVNISTDTNNTDENGNCSKEVIRHFKQVYQVEQWKEEGFSEAADLLDIACHWMGFEPP